ncbi:MAG: DUF4157 domain-containing protein [Gemmatimonadetes bacterium]|nr:DUF4157 domain-containing protein [Gemmatimonadota bacterium]NIQ53484.1 DUF4157 domain-containing protein [Gemmatimonadota bacterium]NIU73626.1 DUF4157 domain-containing protein [Gammaproteobacteria bacterium]NIX43810.1 DUF4157 domain-containing protein [Gemmatimonadota bacterium]NIY08011.1 DUF4157 domain-containing protein [Gemmatimonadota bacterium]
MIGVVSAAARLVAGPRVAVSMPLPPGVEVRRSRLVPWIGGRLSGMGRPAAAVTLGRVVLVHPSAAPPGERLVRHELAHVRQWERAPAAFPIRYMWAHIRLGYANNPYEAEARAAETGMQTSGEEPWPRDP